MKASDLGQVRGTLWKSADELRANSTLSPSEARGPILGLIFLAYAEHRFKVLRPELEAKASPRRPVTPDDYRARSVLFVPAQARLSYLVDLPEEDDLGEALDTAMRLIEDDNSELKGVLPRGYQRLQKSTLTEMLRLFAPLPRTLTGDAFGLIYEYFLSNFAMAEGRLGGEFFTPYSIVRLIVEIIEPFHGKVYDPACGSGGMFVQCAKFVERRQGSATRELSIYGQEQKGATVPIAKMNLALHGLSGDIRLGNSYYEDLHHAVDKFDFVMGHRQSDIPARSVTTLQALDLRAWADPIPAQSRSPRHGPAPATTLVTSEAESGSTDGVVYWMGQGLVSANGGFWHGLLQARRRGCPRCYEPTALAT